MLGRPLAMHTAAINQEQPAHTEMIHGLSKLSILQLSQDTLSVEQQRIHGVENAYDWKTVPQRWQSRMGDKKVAVVTVSSIALELDTSFVLNLVPTARCVVHSTSV
jgi:hypothetical protein